jgi:ribonuclease HI
MAVLLPTLTTIFNAALNLSHYPAHFKRSITVVLRKPGKEDYSQVKSYRPVALLNTIGKVFDTVMAQRISYIVETHQLLPAMHLGGRKGSSVEHAIHILIEKIHAGWSRSPLGGVASLLCLDVSGAFDYVSHSRLLHNLRKRRIDPKIANCIESFLKDRVTTIRLNEHTSAPMDTNTGIPQGSPISPILYLFYNADLLEGCENIRLQTSPIGYIDDISIIATGNSVEENCRNLEACYAQCQEWERKHASKFNPTKCSLIHIPKKWNSAYMQHSIQLPDVDPIRPAEHVRFLGVILDTKMSWNQHIQHVQARAATSLEALSRLAGSTWGMGYRGLRQVYKATIVPQLLYGCSAWYTPEGREGRYRIKQVKKIAAIQHRAARIITGAFRATSQAALEVEAYLAPIKSQLEETTITSYMRIAASPLYTLIESIRRTPYREEAGEAWRYTSKLWTPLEAHHYRYSRIVGRETADNIEKRIPYITAPWWKAPIVAIKEDAKTAAETHNAILQRSMDLLIVYTDGSGINGKIGAASVAPQIGVTRQAYMGTEATSTVYAAELEGIHMALETAIWAGQERGIIFSDSQAALKAIRNPGKSSGQYTLAQIVQQLSDLHQAGRRIDLHWIPAHRGIEGNEAADKAAKEATGWRRSRDRNGRMREIDIGATAPKPARVEYLHSAARRTIRKALHREWEETWRSGNTGRVLYRIAPRPSKRVLKLHQELSKPLSSILVQMRTGRIGLREYLHSRNVSDIEDDRCQCRQASQTISHVLLTCRRHARLRKNLWVEEDGEGRTRRIRTTDLKEILNTPKYAIKATKFVMATRLLGQFGSCNIVEQAEQ